MQKDYYFALQEYVISLKESFDKKSGKYVFENDKYDIIGEFYKIYKKYNKYKKSLI